MIDILGSILSHRANSGFTLQLRRSVLANLLRQDIEYFDKKQAGILQERLNSDTREISSVIFEVPQKLLTNLFFICTTFRVLYADSARLTLTGAACLPFVGIGQYFMVKFFVSRSKRQQNYREITAV
jgi:ABC-type multidrug transport system fused ATPase/permease subunit